MSASLRVLAPEQLVGDDSLLDCAWSERPTFAIAPTRARETAAAWLAQLPAALREDHFAVLSSGSTGRPRLVVGARTRAEEMARAIDRAQDGDGAGCAVQALPLGFAYALVNQWLWARVHGKTFVATRGLTDAASFGDALRRARDAQLCLVPAQVPMLDALGDAAFEGVARVNFAGAPFPQARLAAVRARFPRARVFNNYGCTEAMPRLAVAEVTDDAPTVATRALDGVELRADERGQLQFRSAYGAVAYVDDAGCHALDDGRWIDTGDIGRVRADGRVELEGRVGEVFKRYGERVSLPAVLDTVLAVWRGDVAFYRVEDRAGEDGAVLVLAPRPHEDELRRLLQALRANHRRPHWPLRIESAAAIARLPNGKLDAVTVRDRGDLVTHWDQRLA